jgi:pimeloyl-ACP methyl ester carboxylesterase
MPGLLLSPQPSAGERAGLAVCVVPGAGDTKKSFKWRLVQALLAEGLTVLTVDTPGHGDYRRRPMDYPDCLSAVPAAIRFLRQQPGITRVGLAGISLGGALALRSLADEPQIACQVDALVVLETPVKLKYNRALVRREFWRTISRAPVLSLLREVSIRQIWQSWHAGGYRSRHHTANLIDLLDPPGSLALLDPKLPVLLVYSRRDPIAPPAAAHLLRQAAPQAEFIESKKASHVTLTLIPEINQQVARWLKEQLARS